MTVEEDNAVIDGIELHGMLTIRAQNVTVRRSRIITSGALYGIRIDPEYNGILIEDTEIIGSDKQCGQGIVHNGYTARRVNVSGCEDGLRVGSDTTVERSYVHDLRWTKGAHCDAIQSVGGDNLRIVDNTLVGRWRNSTSAIILQTNIAKMRNVLISGNRLSGGAYTVYVRRRDHGTPANVVIRDNVWVSESWQFGSHSVDQGTGFVWHNNKDDSGANLRP